MRFNSSSDITTPSPLLCSSNASFFPVIFTCFVQHPVSPSIFFAFTFTNVLFLPLYLLVLWMGLRRWRDQGSAASGPTSHSDVFTYQIVSLEITLFHCFTCVERYVAVVYPITYRGLRHSDRVRARNTSIGTLIRLGLGRAGGGQQQTDPAKQKAFNIILVVTGALVVSWLCLPSGLAPPLLFLHRAGALARFGRGLNEGTPALKVALTQHPSEAVGGEAGQGHDSICFEERENTTEENMSVNVTHGPPSISSSNSTISNFYFKCQNSLASMILITIYTVILILLLVPLCILVLYISFQRWRHQRSVPTGQTTSHSDVLTYHTIAVEIIGVLGSVFYVLGAYNRTETVLMIGVLLFCIVFPGHTLLHSLTCVEPYLAVVHPITYHHLRQSLGGRIRNITLGCVWLLCFGWIGVTINPDSPRAGGRAQGEG
ncbi:unnamed protein product [Pleuronectes platessa]|uniref:Uncharacterized protein n=1 Tax=Pleuronectes platessa TaxID=8262 RepID=A0A9N7VLA3_PLEPL|nr:unnamed protein product [Pleuronectes platessa]